MSPQRKLNSASRSARFHRRAVWEGPWQAAPEKQVPRVQRKQGESSAFATRPVQHTAQRRPIGSLGSVRWSLDSRNTGRKTYVSRTLTYQNRL